MGIKVNWLFIAAMALIVIYALKGRHDGFIKTVFSIFSIIIALVVTAAVSPYVSRMLQNNEKLMAQITIAIENTFDWEEEKEEKEEKASSQEEMIDSLKLPGAITNALRENNNSEAYKVLAVKTFSQYISRYLAGIILNAAAFILVFILTAVILSILAKALDILSRLPIINGLNKTAGLLVGILNGLIMLWILCIILTVFSTTAMGQLLYGYINDSAILSSIYDNNLLLRTITDIAKMLF